MIIYIVTYWDDGDSGIDSVHTDKDRADQRVRDLELFGEVRSDIVVREVYND